MTDSLMGAPGPRNPTEQAGLDRHLVVAVEGLNLDMARTFIGQGANVNQVRVFPPEEPGDATTTWNLMDLAWWSGFQTAPAEKVDGMVRLLVENGADPNACAWHVWLNTPSLYLPFIRAGVELNVEDDGEGHHPLVWWWWQEKKPIPPEVLEAMLEHGLDVHGRVNDVTLLGYALGAHDTVAAERLLVAGANVDDFGHGLTIQQVVVGLVNEHLPGMKERAQAILEWWIARERATLMDGLSGVDSGPKPATPSGGRPRL